jgi:Mg2+-importing ATPase
LIYDFSCIAIPFDNVDKDYLQKPRKWDASSLGRFMLWMGPTSSIFDWLTYAMMFFVICPLYAVGSGGALSAIVPYSSRFSRRVGSSKAWRASRSSSI